MDDSGGKQQLQTETIVAVCLDVEKQVICNIIVAATWVIEAVDITTELK